MTEKDKVCALIWKKMEKDLHPELKKEGIEHYGDWIYGKSKFRTQRDLKKILALQIEGTKYYLAQKRREWAFNWPKNLKWYYAKTKNYIAVGWMLETRTEKSLKKEGLLFK